MDIRLTIFLLSFGAISSAPAPSCPFSQPGFNCTCTAGPQSNIFQDVSCLISTLIDTFPKFNTNPGKYSINGELRILYQVPRPPPPGTIVKIDSKSFIDFTSIGSLLITALYYETLSLSWNEAALQGVHVHKFSTNNMWNIESAVNALKLSSMNDLESIYVRLGDAFHLRGGAFKGFKKLSSLQIRAGQLKEKPDKDALAGLEDSLVDLSLAFDFVDETILPAVTNLHQLKTLDVSWNYIKSIDLSGMDGLKSLELLDISYAGNLSAVRVTTLDKVPPSLNHIKVVGSGQLSDPALSFDSTLAGLLERQQFQLLNITNSPRLDCNQNMQWMAKFALCSPVKVVINGSRCSNSQSLEEYLKATVPNPCQ